MKPLVTAIVASYNHAEYLDLRIESLIKQTYSNLEILVIDDKSTDNSVAVLKKYESVPNVKIVELKENSGWVAVSNLGCKMAKGEFIVYSNCDDFCASDQIEKLVVKMVQYPNVGLVYSRSKLVDENNNMYGNDFDCRTHSFKKKYNFDTHISRDEMRDCLLDSCVIPNLSAALMRKDAFIAAGGFSKDFLVVSDWSLFFKMTENYDFYYIAEELNSFRNHKTTIRSQTKTLKLLTEYQDLLYFWSQKVEMGIRRKIEFYIMIAKIIINEGLSSKPPLTLSLWSASMRYNKMIIFFLVGIFFLQPFKKFLKS